MTTDPAPASRPDRTPSERPARPTPERYREILREHLAPLLERAERSTHLPLAACAGSVLAADLRAPVDLPLFVNSQMDGFAVRSADVAGATAERPVRLRVVGTTRAGDAPGSGIDDDEAHRVMTGAPVPEGADCVVPVEDTAPGGDDLVVGRPRDPGGHGGTPGHDGTPGLGESGGESVLVHAPRAAGEFVRRPGDDVRAGDLVLSAGARLEARHLAAAASLGVSGLDVRPRPRVAVIATGAELVAPGRPLGPGQIWESNSLTLAAAAKACGCDVSSVATTSDDRSEFERTLHAAAGAADLVVTVGAVSMGDAEVVRQVLADREGSRFAPIAMQPGGPQGIATWRDTPVVCLPGNPVSALVSFVVLLRPVLLEAVGRAPVATLRGRLSRAVTSPEGKVQYLRAARSAAPHGPAGDSPRDSATGGLVVVDPVSGPGSHLVAAMARAEFLAEIPADVTALPAGAEVDLIPL